MTVDPNNLLYESDEARQQLPSPGPAPLPRRHRLLTRCGRDEPIRISAYRPEWPSEFERERAALAEAIGKWAVGGIHHVGSTAVPGLDAKPVVDILVGVADLESSRACFEPLAGLDYVHAPYLETEMHWFCKPHPSRRTHHLHLVPQGSRRYADELAFRDHLRADPDSAAQYAALKRELANRFDDRPRRPTRRPRASSSGRLWAEPRQARAEVAEREPALAQHLPVIAGLDLGDVDDGRWQAGQRAAVDREVGRLDDLRRDLGEPGAGRACR